jgi:hypothetical protein
MDPASMALTAIFKGPQFVQSLATMIGLLESTNQKLDKLIASDFEVATRHLVELSNDVKLETREFLLQEAWKRFAAAITLEAGERKAMAYVGLAFAQFHSGEKRLAIGTLSDLTKYSYVDKPAQTKKMAKLGGAAVLGAFLWIPAVVGGAAAYVSLSGQPEKRDATLHALRYGAMKWLAEVPRDARVELLKAEARKFIESEGQA